VEFDSFVRQEIPQLYRYARLLTGSSDTAHDVVADVLLRAQGQWQRIGSIEYPVAYVRTMITNQFLQDRRKWSFRMITPTRWGVLPEVSAPDASTVIDDRAQIQTLLRGLPARQRAAVAMRFLLDLTDDQIGTELGITPVSVRSLISRGLAGLRAGGADSDGSNDSSDAWKATT
jgi:RNA polymerase sigma factor (sigma-70 family)